MTKRITPLEKCRIEKSRLRESCKRQEAKLLDTIDFVEENLVPLSLGATAKALTSPSKLASSMKSSGAEGSGIAGLVPKGLVGFALKTAFGFFVKKKFGKKSIPARVLGLAFPIAAPVAALAWKHSQPFVANFVKKKT